MDENKSIDGLTVEEEYSGEISLSELLAEYLKSRSGEAQ